MNATITTTALRDGLASDVLGALDFAESIRNGLLREHTQEGLAVDDETFAEYQRHADNAYSALVALRVATDWRRETRDKP